MAAWVGAADASARACCAAPHRGGVAVQLRDGRIDYSGENPVEIVFRRTSRDGLIVLHIGHQPGGCREGFQFEARAYDGREGCRVLMIFVPLRLSKALWCTSVQQALQIGQFQFLAIRAIGRRWRQKPSWIYLGYRQEPQRLY